MLSYIIIFDCNYFNLLYLVINVYANFLVCSFFSIIPVYKNLFFYFNIV